MPCWSTIHYYVTVVQSLVTFAHVVVLFSVVQPGMLGYNKFTYCCADSGLHTFGCVVLSAFRNAGYNINICNTCRQALVFTNVILLFSLQSECWVQYITMLQLCSLRYLHKWLYNFLCRQECWSACYTGALCGIHTRGVLHCSLCSDRNSGVQYIQPDITLVFANLVVFTLCAVGNYGGQYQTFTWAVSGII